jgi:hypothetical protein
MNPAVVSAIAESVGSGAFFITGTAWIISKIAQTIRTSAFKAARQVTDETAARFNKVTNEREERIRQLIDERDERIRKTADRADRGQYITLALSLATGIVALVLSLQRKKS